MIRLGWIPQPNIPAARIAMLTSRQLFRDVRPNDTVAFADDPNNDRLEPGKRRDDGREMRRPHIER
jgi:hypothetical protein